MNVSLTPELEKFINEKVASGMYYSASEVIREGLRLLKEQEALKAIRIEELKKKSLSASLKLTRDGSLMGRQHLKRLKKKAANADKVKLNGTIHPHSSSTQAITSRCDG